VKSGREVFAVKGIWALHTELLSSLLDIVIKRKPFTRRDEGTPYNDIT